MKKIIGIFICMLLICMVIPTVGMINVKNHYKEPKIIIEPIDVPDYYLNGADQYLTSHCGYGDEIFSPLMAAQEFKPTKEDLTAVALGFFKSDPPSGLEITVSIRDALDGIDLAVKTVGADLIKKNFKETWLMFDFPDITVIPENTYYIVCSVNGGVTNESILWFFNINNQYERGIAWFSGDSGETWFDEENIPDWPQIDYCFITYNQEPPESTIINDYFPSETCYNDFPDYFSWSDYEGKDWTTSPKDQGSCGCCFIFGAIGALESVINIREGISDLNPDLSEQYVMSCLIRGACYGGQSWTVFDRIFKNDSTGNNCNGIIPEICFPYQADDTISCDLKSNNWQSYIIPISDYGKVQVPEIDEIKSKIMQYGPVSIEMICTEKFFNWVATNHNPDDYFPLDEESDYGLPHMVLAVGWKDDESISEGGYWICKNSWGLDHGYNGFFNIGYAWYIGQTITWVDYDPESYDWHPTPKANGPYFGIINESIQFNGDSSGEHPPFTYQWDFGDETFSTDQNPSHSYKNEGEFNVILTVTDDVGNSFYDETYAWIQETNQPPNKPRLIGFPIATPGEFYYYNFTINDPDNSVVYYYYEVFGNDKGAWSDPIESGKERTAMWWTPTNGSGIKKIRMKAKDPYGAESDWATIPVAIPINNSITMFNPFLSRLIQHFPIIKLLI